VTADPNTERDKWNRCKFACGLCDLVTVDSRQMRLHIATHHGLSMDAYTKQYGTTEIVTRKFRCELCNSEMKFCRQNIYAHMKDVHKITLNDYEGQIGILANEIIPVEEMGDHPPRQIVVDNSMMAASSNDEIVLEGMDPTTVPVAQGDDYVDTGLLDDGKKPSRWNKCRFRCAICGKLSSEKRHVREHIIKFHGLSLPEYEAQYGDCEIHTEYFFCGVCHAEVKHNLKNISLHLQNVHAMSPTQYEMSYGMIPEDEDVDVVSASDYGGFGGHHFLLDDNIVETYDNPLDDNLTTPVVVVDPPKVKNLPNPPKSDILNPKNKYCKPCNREFNRRQAFVEHCRTVHGMKIRFAKANTGTTVINSKAFANLPPPQVPIPVPVKAPASSANGYPCQYCGKVFSNQSNRRRHAVLSCELARSAGVEPRRSREEKRNSAPTGSSSGITSSPGHLNRTSEVPMTEDFYYEDGLPGSRQQAAEPQKCPFPECSVSSMRSALLKRHLFEAHNIQNVSVELPDLDSEKKKKSRPMKIKMEPLDMLEIEHGDAETDRKVPPLRVKISQVMGRGGKGPGEGSPIKAGMKPYVACPICNEFKSNNLYILGRHQRSCEKKMEAKQAKQQLDLDTTGESTEHATNDDEDDEDDGDTTIEVPVDFEEQPENEEAEDGTESVTEPETEIHEFGESEEIMPEQEEAAATTEEEEEEEEKEANEEMEIAHEEEEEANEEMEIAHEEEEHEPEMNDEEEEVATNNGEAGSSNLVSDDEATNNDKDITTTEN
jgi:hypothetical protein